MAPASHTTRTEPDRIRAYGRRHDRHRRSLRSAIDIPQADLDDLRRAPGAHPLARRAARTPAGTTACRVGYVAGARRPLAHRLRLARLGGAAQRATRSSRPRSTGRTSTSCTSARPSPTRCRSILTHGWPGSIVEYLDVIGPLTDPRAHGGDPADAFHLVIPSLPGYGFSGPTREPGWTTCRIAAALGRADGAASATSATARSATTPAR